jgi:ceramide glucosyltransferase
VSTIGLIALSSYLVILATKFVLARRYAATHPEHATLDAPITILQPILGGDPFLEDALRANLANAPSSALFFWLVDEDDMEGRRVTTSIDDPRIRRLLSPPPRADENPKTAKLQRALEQIDTPYFAVLDDDTILEPDHLGRALAALQSCTLYTGLPCYLAGANLWSSLVAHFVNNNSILTYLALLPLAPPLTINGMFYVMRTDDLRAMNGFAPILSKLCDDYALAAQVKQHGGTIRQGITPQFLRTTVPDARRYTAIMQRWFLFANVLLRDQPAKVQLLLIPFLGLPPLFFALSFLSIAGGVKTTIALAGALIVRHALLRNLHKTIFELQHPAQPATPDSQPVSPADRQPPTANPVQFNPITSILSELLQPLHWLHACVQHSLRWRTRRITLGPDGTFSYVGQD